MALKYIGEFEEGALIDGCLKYLINNQNMPDDISLNNYVRNELFKGNIDYNLQSRIIGFIRSKIEQYSLVKPSYKNDDIITGLGRDIIEMGGFNQWRSNEEGKIMRQENRENGMYNINKLLGLLAIVTLIFSIYQFVNSNQLETRIKRLEDFVSIIRKNNNVRILKDSSHLKLVIPLNKIKK